MRWLLALAALPLMLEPGVLAAQGEHSSSKAIVVTAGTESWGPAPAVLPAGATLAVLEGDPSQSGPYTMRLRMPDGYRIPPHFHPGDEHVTVLSGTFLVGMGEHFDRTGLKALPAGTFGMIPTGMRHFAEAKGVTVIQLHGIGPWSLTYVNPADTPKQLGRSR